MTDEYGFEWFKPGKGWRRIYFNGDIGMILKAKNNICHGKFVTCYSTCENCYSSPQIFNTYEEAAHDLNLLNKEFTDV